MKRKRVCQVKKRGSSPVSAGPSAALALGPLRDAAVVRGRVVEPANEE